MRDLLAGKVSLPKYHLVNDRIDLASAAGSVGFPAVLKPSALAGSLHVKRVNNAGELSCF